jgi:uncharacterized cupredoxin-like copper-binding protein
MCFFRRLLIPCLLALVMAYGVVAAQEATPLPDASIEGYPELVITVTDTGFEVEPEATEGRYLVTFHNTGSEGAGMFFWRLPDGVTVEELASALPTREPGSTGTAPEAFYEAFLPGAPGYAEAGGSTQAIVDLPAGEYVVLTEEGAWATPLTIHAAADATPSAQPEPDASPEIVLQEYAFDHLSDTFAAGRHIWKVTNGGHQPHQMIVGKVPDGMTFQQVLAGFQPPPDGTPVAGAMRRADFHAVGGLEIISPGNSAWSIIDLQEPGTYAVVCLVPDEHSGMLHVAEGMAAVFTVETDGAAPTA